MLGAYRFGNVAAMGGAGSKTEAQWVTQAAVLTANSIGFANFLGTGTCRLVASTPTGDMAGTTWNSAMGCDSTSSRFGRAIQHAFPTQTQFDDNVTNGRTIVIIVAGTGVQTATFASSSRNGYTSLTDATDQTGYKITNIKWWDAALGKVQQCNPSIAGATTDYVW